MFGETLKKLAFEIISAVAFQMRRSGVNLTFQFIPKVVTGVEVRDL